MVRYGKNHILPENLRIFIIEDLLKIGTFNVFPGLIYIIGELFIKSF